MTEKILDKLKFLFPNDYEFVNLELNKLIDEYSKKISTDNSKDLFTEKDIMLICYGDHVYEDGEKTLKTFNKFCLKYLKNIFNRIHFLPFFPYSSDDGFSVIDYYKINSKLGDWNDVREISSNFKLMFDFVMNHISAKSEWFQEFLKGNLKYKNYFISFDSKVNVSSVFRPRTHPLLSEFETGFGKKFVWTTFSEDQIDINISEPSVFLEIIKIFLFFIENGARAVRLDAIAFLWKELETSCINLKQTHEVVKIMRLVIEELKQKIWIITETNIPHKDNVSYFGKGDEAHLVYNFSLPPLLIYSFMKQDASKLTAWAKELEFIPNCTFFNFTASHDGIGVTPLKGIISDSEIVNLAEYVKLKKGRVNYRTAKDLEPQPYELNIVYRDAFENEDAFISSQAIQLSLRGVPGIYFNSIIGAHNDLEGLEKLGYNRAINREKFEFSKLCSTLKNNSVFEQYSHMIEVRINEELFSPLVNQEVLTLDPKLFTVKRFNDTSSIVCVTNVSTDFVFVDLEKIFNSTKVKDIISSETIDESFALGAYQTVWLKQL